MDIYIQSCGVSQDYRWLKIIEKDQRLEKPFRKDPPIPDQVKSLIDTDAHSIVLSRFNNKLILLVTGLGTSQRADDRDR
ncbi:MAG: hypothetical protein ICV78_19925 [Tolypothrix sp. Co-bin9]|nr:hypothetical protein [Tolypothrix sp. Co-bin9]